MTSVNELLLIVLVVVAFLLLAFAELFQRLAGRCADFVFAWWMGRENKRRFQSLENADRVARSDREPEVTVGRETPELDREREVRIPLFHQREDD